MAGLAGGEGTVCPRVPGKDAGTLKVLPGVATASCPSSVTSTWHPQGDVIGTLTVADETLQCVCVPSLSWPRPPYFPGLDATWCLLGTGVY